MKFLLWARLSTHCTESQSIYWINPRGSLRVHRVQGQPLFSSPVGSLPAATKRLQGKQKNLLPRRGVWDSHPVVVGFGKSLAFYKRLKSFVEVGRVSTWFFHIKQTALFLFSFFCHHSLLCTGSSSKAKSPVALCLLEHVRQRHSATEVYRRCCESEEDKHLHLARGSIREGLMEVVMPESILSPWVEFDKQWGEGKG